MHSLSTISRLNAEAYEVAIEHLRQQGRDVVANYDGLHLMSIESFSDSDEALEAFTKPADSPSEHRKLFTAYAAPQATADMFKDNPELSPTCDGSGHCAECAGDGMPEGVRVIRLKLGDLLDSMGRGDLLSKLKG